MSILPKKLDITVDTEISTQSSDLKTYAVENGRVIGYIENIKAIEQTIYKIMRTERFQYIIYDWDYGIELQELFGKSPDYVVADLKRRFEEALLQNEYITEIQDFDCSITGKDTIQVVFVVVTQFGNIEIEEVLNNAITNEEL